MEHMTDRITLDSDLCNGRPTIRGKRITVHSVLEFLSAGSSVDEILQTYPSLEKEDMSACLKFASQLMERSYTIKEVA